MKTSLVAAAGLLAWSGMAMGQVPTEIAAKVRAAGHTLDRGAGELYVPMFGPEAWSGMTITRDVAYGSDPLQKLDLYVPEGKGAKRPVLLFVHGGGFVGGDKHGPFYPDNITAWAAKQGMVGVNIDYRLAPKAPWPAAAEDLAAALRWVRANIAQHGGDPDRIILWGHSAGANHVADYVSHPEVEGPEFAGVKGAILLSPFYAADPGEAPTHAYYGSDADLQGAAGAIDRLWRSTVPLFLADAEFDLPGMQAFATAAHERLCETPERCSQLVELKNHNHLTEGMAVGTTDTSLSGPVLHWIRMLVGS
jgi:triacylglycerol lipase